MKKFTISMLALALAFSVTSCKKDTPEEPAPAAPSAPGNPVITPEDADGVLIGIKTVTKVATVPGFPASEIQVGTAVAVFPAASGSGFVDAGSVKCNDKSLTKQSNNSYVFTPNTTSPTGIEFGSAEWLVAGNDNVPFIERTFGNFPSTPEFTSPSTVSTASAYTLTLDEYTGGDSVIVSFISTNKTVTKTYSGAILSFQFTAEEMATLSKGDGYIQVAPYSFQNSTIGGKNIYFINEAVTTNTVKFN